MQNIGSKIDSSQYDAPRKKSTSHALVDMTHHWHSAVDKGQIVRNVSVDFAKAFDHVDHNILVDSKRSLGLSNIIIIIIIIIITSFDGCAHSFKDDISKSR